MRQRLLVKGGKITAAGPRRSKAAVGYCDGTDCVLREHCKCHSTSVWVQAYRWMKRVLPSPIEYSMDGVPECDYFVAKRQ